MSSLLLIVLSAVLICHYAPLVMGTRVFEETDGFFDAVGVAIASLSMMAIMAPLAYVLERELLARLDIGYLRLLILVVIVATLAHLVSLLMPRWGWTPIRQPFVMLMTAHTAVLGLALLGAQADSLTDALWMGIGIGVAFGIALLAFTSLHGRVLQANIPTIFQDAPIALISIGLMALAFMGLTGLVRD